MVVSPGMPFVSPHSALFGKQFQRQSCSPLISLGGVHLFILCTPQLFLSFVVVRYRSCKKGQKCCRKGEAAVAKDTTQLGRQEARLAGGQASCKPKRHSGHLSPTACILTPCADALRWERRQPLGIPFYSGEELAPSHGTWRAWVADTSLKPKSGPGKEGQTADWEAAVRSPPGNAGAKLGGRNWGWGHWEQCPQEEVADAASEVGTLPGKVATLPLMGTTFAACCNRDAWLQSLQCCCELATMYWRDNHEKSPLPGTNRQCVSS